MAAVKSKWIEGAAHRRSLKLLTLKQQSSLLMIYYLLHHFPLVEFYIKIIFTYYLKGNARLKISHISMARQQSYHKRVFDM